MLILHIFAIFSSIRQQAIFIARSFDVCSACGYRTYAASSAQNDGESLVTSHQSLVTAKQKRTTARAVVLWLSGVDFFLSGEAGLLEVHASGVNGMYPAFLMAILPSKDGDGDP